MYDLNTKHMFQIWALKYQILDVLLPSDKSCEILADTAV